ncbi:hypothetical protein B9Z55_028487 [Caenorhabditis nigoni]|uniref:Uncharacterized protein n=1 Tax=Caenorhabditis nigoni TaxID=1611254 RepID=A0A2G5SBS0_9PELO|nr:hypothetical protein B9Z55_028487 [Caenorhabditis nigoni]
MNMAKRANKKIGFVVDLNNMYRKTQNSRKLNCPGHDVNEREDLVEGFIKSVREFVEDPENVFEYYGGHPMERQHHKIALYETAQRRNAEKMKPKEDDENTRKEEVGDMTTD